MKTLNLLFTLALGSLAATAPKPVTVDPPRFITVDERSVVKVYVAPFNDTLIVLPAAEQIKTVFIGNSSDWTPQSTKEPSRYLSVKIKVAPAPTTTLNIISNHDKPYSFELIESDDHCDSKVFLEADAALTQELQKEPWLSPEDAARLRKQAEDAKADAVKAQQTVTADVNAFKSIYPSKLHFAYDWDHKRGRTLGIEEIFHDGQFTYVRADPQEAPALYEIKDGKPSLIDAPFRDGIYTVTKIVRQGYLAVGKQKVEFTLRGN